MSNRYTTKLAVFIATALAVASCSMKDQEAPPLSGPSEFGQSIVVAASPDLLPQDGASQSLITVTARDPNGAPLRNVSLRGEILVNGAVAADFGSLSARSVVTGADGRATFVYTAPPSPAVSPDNFTVVFILVTPIGSNFDVSYARHASIRLTPQGTVIPHDDLVPAFTFSPSSPTENQNVLFDASTSQGTIASYRWDYGDGESGSGRVDTHDFASAGSYTVTLTITDPYGRTAFTTRQVTVSAGADPTASFVVSPTEPRVGQQVNFNASASRPASGGTIVSYRWDWGDGSPLVTTASPVANHIFGRATAFTVTLVVTDQAGKTGVVSVPLEIQP